MCVCVWSQVSLGLIVLQETGYDLDRVTMLQLLFQLVLVVTLIVSWSFNLQFFFLPPSKIVFAID